MLGDAQKSGPWDRKWERGTRARRLSDRRRVKKGKNAQPGRQQ